MIVDFSKVDLSARQVLVVENLDGTIIQPLLHVLDGNAKLRFNEISELSFSIPYMDAGQPVPGYSAVAGMRVIDWFNVGRFILVEPEVINDGVTKLKKCKAYSLEYELTYKTFYIPEGSHRLLDILNMIFDSAPSWSLGKGDPTLLQTYRYFSGESYNVYDFLKNTAQELFSCVFDFDTYARTIHVMDANAVVAQQPVFISTQNLAKEISITEKTEELFTAFNVTGAEDVDIRAVNPTGSNILYNLDHFMTTEYFTQEVIDKWNAWKAACVTYRQPYYLLAVERVLNTNRLATEQANRILLQTEIDVNSVGQAEVVGLHTSGKLEGIDESAVFKTMAAYLEQKKVELAEKDKLIKSIDEELAAVVEQQQAINEACSLSTYFTHDELVLLDKYIRVSDFNEPSFIYREAVSYTDSDSSWHKRDIAVHFSDSSIVKIPLDERRAMYRGEGGSITVEMLSTNYEQPPTWTLTGEVVSFVLEDRGDASAILTAEIVTGTETTADSSSAVKDVNLTVLWNMEKSSLVTIRIDDSTFVVDEELDEKYETGSVLHIDAYSSYFADSQVNSIYVTKKQTEYSNHLVQWNLMEFAESEIRKASSPRYQFKVDSTNFFTAHGFEEFKNAFCLGRRVYIEVDNGVITPIATGADLSFDDLSKLSLEFGDEYSAFDSEFQLVDILGKTVASTKKYEASKGAYHSFVSSGAKDKLCDFTSSSLDLAKNSIMSSSNMSVSFDSSGLKLRQYLSDNKTFDPKQLWAVNNSIVFTKDNWNSVSLALGEVYNPITQKRDYGLCAEVLIGEMIAGNSLVIRSATEHDKIAEFCVNGDGARLCNAKFDLLGAVDLEGNQRVISMHPEYGLVGGVAGAYTILNDAGEETYHGVLTEKGERIDKIAKITETTGEPRANFWIDMCGDAYFKGTIYADKGVFKGTVSAATIEAATITGTLSGSGNDDAAIEGVSLNINDKFKVDKDGNVIMEGDINLNGDIMWGTQPIMYEYAPTSDAKQPVDPEDIQTEEWSPQMRDTDYWRHESYNGGKTWEKPYQFRGKDGSSAKLPTFIEKSKITRTTIESPIIAGNNITALHAFTVGFSDEYTQPYGHMGYAQGLSDGKITHGVALSSGGFKVGKDDDGYIDYQTAGINYLIVTDSGVRMQSGGGSAVYVSEGGNGVDAAAYIEIKGANNQKTIYKFQQDGLYINGALVVENPSWQETDE